MNMYSLFIVRASHSQSRFRELQSKLELTQLRINAILSDSGSTLSPPSGGSFSSPTRSSSPLADNLISNPSFMRASMPTGRRTKVESVPLQHSTEVLSSGHTSPRKSGFKVSSLFVALSVVFHHGGFRECGIEI